MKKVIILGASAAGAGIALLGAGTAIAAPTGADDVVGQPYADATSALVDAGVTPVVGVVVGGKLPTDECIVTNVQSVSAIREGLIDTVTVVDEVVTAFSPAVDEVVVTLNCNGNATASNPGNSLLSPAGREARNALAEAGSAESEELEAVSTPDE
jgi:hypothetical protein